MKIDRDLLPIVVAVAMLCTAVILTASGFALYRAFVPVCDPDPWACFGAGRYDAMRDGRVCECYDKEHLR
jgi:hypothetical protein